MKSKHLLCISLTFLSMHLTSCVYQTIPGQPGPQGEAGPQGPAGHDGQNGTNGKDGVDGEPGPQGPKGDKGDQGDQGKDGTNGIDGKSAYEIYLSKHPEYIDEGEEKWLHDLANGYLSDSEFYYDYNDCELREINTNYLLDFERPQGIDADKIGNQTAVYSRDIELNSELLGWGSGSEQWP